MDAFRLGIGEEPEALEAANVMTFDLYGAVFGNFRVKFVLLLEPEHQGASTPVHEALGQALVQRIRQAVLNGACASLPMLWIDQPIAAVGHVRPGADADDAVGKRNA